MLRAISHHLQSINITRFMNACTKCIGYCHTSFVLQNSALSPAKRVLESSHKEILVLVHGYLKSTEPLE